MVFGQKRVMLIHGYRSTGSADRESQKHCSQEDVGAEKTQPKIKKGAIYE